MHSIAKLNWACDHLMLKCLDLIPDKVLHTNLGTHHVSSKDFLEMVTIVNLNDSPSYQITTGQFFLLEQF